MEVFNNKDELEKYVRESRRALILFCASWCPFCREFFPTFDKLVAKDDFDMVVRVYIDDYDNPLWEDYRIEAVPMVMLLEKGKVKGRIDSMLGSGLSEKTFGEWLNRM